MRPTQDKPKKAQPLNCEFTREEINLLSNARQLADSCKGKSKKEAAGIMKALTQHQQDLMIRWLSCRFGGHTPIIRG